MNKKRHSTIWLHFAGVVFITILCSLLCVSLIWLLLYKFNVIEIDPSYKKAPLLFLAFGSLLLGGSVAIYVGKTIITPIQNIGKAFHKLSEGDFSVKVSEDEKKEEIREIAKQFNAMTYDLSHIETLRNDFVANVSHEFKTPISSIEGYATLLQNPNLSIEKREYYIDKIIDNSRRLSNLTSNILLLSRLENQEMVLDNSVFRLDEQIRKTILLLEDKWNKKNIQFDLNLPLQMYYGSEELLEHVWFNLLDNAIKYSKTNGTIKIYLKQEEKNVIVSITDNGEGMNEEVIKHIFEKFYQKDSSRKNEGNGLGLALVKRIINICKGEITVSSEENKGSTFVIKLPYTSCK